MSVRRSERSPTRRMRFSRAIFPCVALFCLVTYGSAQASTQRYTYHFDTARLRISGTNDAATIVAPGMSRTWVAGHPEIPYETITFLIPQDTRLEGVRVMRQTTRLLRDGVQLAAASARTTDDGDLVQPPRVAKASGARRYPEHAAAMAGSAALQGYKLARVRVYPLQYDAVARQLLAHEVIEVEIDVAADPARPLERQRYRAAHEQRALNRLSALVVNPEDIPDYERRIGALVEPQRRGFHPTHAPSLEGSPVDYVIITSQALEAAFGVLADWKTRRGVPTVIRTLEWIEANYRHGSDLQETVRTFIQDAYAKWGVQFVLLGGDTDVIPARYGYSRFGPATEEEIPTDLYFACLDGNWNADGDDLWGEAALDETTPVDEADFYAEVLVGRLPVSTPEEASALIAKIIEYEDPSNTSYQDEMLFLAEVLFPVNWQPGNPVSTDGAAISEAELLPHVDACMDVTRLYQNHTAYPGSLPLNLAATLAELDSGYGFVNHIGHGFRYNMSCGDKSLVTSHAADLANGDERFVLYMLNCTAVAFDFPCLAEAFLKTAGGAVAVLGSSRAAFANPARNYNAGFFEAVFDSVTPKNVGAIFNESRLEFTSNTLLDNSDHYSHLLYNMLADPEMVMHTCALGSTAVTLPGSVALGNDQVTVNVTVDGMPREGALVCLQKGDEEYSTGRTDANGDATLNFVAESGGSVEITVSGQNMTTYSGMLSVDTSNGAYVHVRSATLDDDTDGTTSGNADAVLDAGETVGFDVLLANDGSADAADISGVLRIDSPWVTVDDSSYSTGAIVSGATAMSSGQLVVSVSPSTPDGTVLALEFESTDGAQTWTDSINRIVHAPALEITLLELDDPLPGGNGDGVIQAGESFDLRVCLKNYGSGVADAVQATLSSSDDDVTITTNNVTIGDVGAIEEATSPPLRLSESSIEDNLMTVTLQDAYGRISFWNMTLREPGPPDSLHLDASQGSGVVVLTWLPPVDTDVVGYHVYRGPDPAGPWTRATVDRTSGVAYFRDTGLAASTEYSYYATAVDVAGNESAPSAVASINTNPALLAGWPIFMSEVSSCPPAVGDITGDGSKEIVAGNGTLYAWGWDGIEVLDDDGDPQTWGVFGSEMQTVTAAIVLAEFDASPGLEVFACSWDDSNRSYVFRGDGSAVNGWPQLPNPGSGTRGFWGAPAASDVDGDGLAEVFAPSKDGNLYAWHADGSPVGTTAAFKSGLGVWMRSSPAIANLDGDPQAEIVFPAVDGTLHIWNTDGTSVNAHFPMALGGAFLSSPAIGDVNDDGRLDVVVVNEGDAVYVLDVGSGAPLPGWPVSLSIAGNPFSPSPALADFDDDGQLEIVVANNASPVSQSAVQIYDAQGSVLPGWPVLVDAHTSESSPIVADFSGDGVPDIVFGNEGGLLYGWDWQGNALAGFPINVGGEIRAVPYADDFDDDGDIDLALAGWDQNLWVWDFVAPFDAAAAQWPTFKHDAQRTAYYDHRPWTPTDVGDDSAAGIPVPARAFLRQNVPNPFNPLTTIAYGVPREHGKGHVQVRIDVFDVKGRLVRRLVNGRQDPGVYTALWDGRDDSGRGVQSGVYFYRLRTGTQTESRKMLVLR